ncbi:unnamed protein product [Moneuplotes crassus]|uniref:Uncharacterized protein n=1 Tax=Euplotes crassus TaxID=5936 RepID=A0AAD1U727_EUPCR|nr:unnamed protein product [Moneuplotes crassus]
MGSLCDNCFKPEKFQTNLPKNTKNYPRLSGVSSSDTEGSLQLYAERQKLLEEDEEIPSSAPNCSNKTDRTVSQTNSGMTVSQTTLCSSTEKKTKVSIDDFEMLKVIGRGSFGKVLLVRHKETMRLYAMKSLRKENFKEEKDKTNCIIERVILEQLNSNFVVKLHYAFQSLDKAYFVIDYMQGGDLFFHLQKNKRFSVKRVKFYIAECVLALQDLHKKGIIYRDLKLENIMLDCQGHIKLTDFGLCCLSKSKPSVAHDLDEEGSRVMAYSFVGTQEYLSPEVVKGIGYNQSTDWWSLGAIMFEMLSGESPFADKSTSKTLKNICYADVCYKEIYSKKAQKLISRLLERNPKKRLGANQGAIEIMQDPFFKEINWNELKDKNVKPPFAPKNRSECCVKYFSQEFIEEDAEDSFVESSLTVLQKSANHIDRFTYGFNDGFVDPCKSTSYSVIEKSADKSKTFEGIPEMDPDLEQ